MALEGSPLVMAIETSCDETAVAILAGTDRLLSSQIASQVALHEMHGGVVPEIASRSHLTQLKPLISRALMEAGIDVDQIDAFAATAGPGLATSLMIGASAAKGLAIASAKPYLAINHLEGHLLSPFFGAKHGVRPCAGLIVSGGHTLLVDVEAFGKYRMLGQTQDDAAGEAFDKVGKLLELPYPGGPQIDRLAGEGDATRFDFPRSMLKSENLNFSFSGLKTSVRYLLPKLNKSDVADVCASFQEAVVDVLVRKTIAAAQQTGHRLVTISGGVSCNSRLREKFRAACGDHHLELLMAEPWLCTDNAAMIAYIASERLARDETTPLEADIDPNLQLVTL